MLYLKFQIVGLPSNSLQLFQGCRRLVIQYVIRFIESYSFFETPHLSIDKIDYISIIVELWLQNFNLR